MSNVHPLPVRVTLVCAQCGAAGEGTCHCGAPYVPPRERASAAVTADPEKSDRDHARDLGVSRTTVRRARKAGGSHGPPGKRQGRDGKRYTIKPTPKPETTAARRGRRPFDLSSPAMIEQAAFDFVAIYGDTVSRQFTLALADKLWMRKSEPAAIRRGRERERAPLSKDMREAIKALADRGNC
jgi:hypothetical protein